MSKNQDIIGWNRRDFIGAAALLALAVGVPVATIPMSHLEPSESPNEQQVALLRDGAQLIIPRTCDHAVSQLKTSAI